MNQPFETAAQVSEYLLEKTGRAILGDDVEEFIKYVTLPIEIQTFEGRRVIRRQEEMRKVFGAVRAHYATIGVTDMVRYCVEAAFTDADTVVAMHETRLITGSVIKRNPFPTLSMLKFDGEDWKIVSCSYAIEDQKEHNAALMSAGENLLPDMI